MRRVLAGAALAAALPAFAAPPLTTDDADVLEPRSCELDVAAQRQQGRGAGQVQLGCGFGWRSQAALAWGCDSGRSEDGAEQRLALSGKTRLIERGEGIGLTAAWGLSLARSGRERVQRDTSALALLASGPVAEGVNWHLNLGWARSHRDRVDATTWGLAGEWSLGASGIDLVAEVFGDDREGSWRSVGLRWALRDDLRLYAARAQSHAAPRERQTTLGLVFAF